ncbi:hypothetical protein AB0I72_27380 [Nocardiopsis sp. NPDC049922]|uniref:hypothetical protein n=1 Tax=Nocardiopsis sp. NPDC049922 TaxID=3155157 RepID=UPI0033EA6AF6
MKVYRVEFPHRNGGYVGPYNCHRDFDGDMSDELNDLLYELGQAHSWWRSNRHPALHGPDGCSIAVRSMRDLFSWFGGFLPKLLRHGARIGVYEVDKAYVLEEDEYQLAYLREFAKDVTGKVGA